MAINITAISAIDPRRQEITSPEGVFSVLQDQKRRFTVFFEDILQPTIDAEAEPEIARYDPETIEFIEYDPYDTELRIGSLLGGEVKKVADGEYYFETRDAALPARPHSDTYETGMQTVLWKSQRVANAEEEQAFQYLIIYNLAVARLLPRLKNQVDKAQKDTGTTVGYTTSNLVMYLQGALEQINSVQPLTGLTFHNFPFSAFTQLLIDAATVVALYSQGLFAIDTDMSYSDQGFSFVIDHYSKISGFLGMLISRLATQMQSFKYAFISSGALHIEMGASYRMTELLQAAPGGALFRNLFAR